MAHIIWAPRAFADLENLLAYIARSEPATARRFGQRVLDRIESLADFPDSDSFVPEDEKMTYREVFQGPYRIIFRRVQAKSCSLPSITALDCCALTNWKIAKTELRHRPRTPDLQIPRPLLPFDRRA